MTGFRNGTFQILVATDIAARGIDVTQVSHVINYDIPNTTDAYIHRIGRTGRAARSGDAYTLVAGEDTDMVRDIERVLGGPVERRTVAGFDYTAATTRKDSEFGRPPRQHVPARRPERTSKQPGNGSAYQPKASSVQRKTHRNSDRVSGWLFVINMLGQPCLIIPSYSFPTSSFPMKTF
jgi:ATP-dependent RNA helicase RhlE